jgi:hypothetical protein
MTNLLKKEVIKAFRIHIDYSLLDKNIFKLDINLKKHKLMKQILKYLIEKPYLQCLNVGIGWADIEPELILKDVNELTNIIDDINKRFPDSIRKYNYWLPEKVHKERWLPEIFEK